MPKWRNLSVLAVGVMVVGVSACSGGDADPAGTSNTFSIGIDEPDHLTPGRASGAYDEVHALFAPLVQIGENGDLEYVQAESVTTTDNKVWTIKIKSGWTFHNGEKVTAQSYADAWNATAYGPNAWANNGQLAGIQGYAELNPAEGEPTVKELSGVKVVDETTLEVTLTRPDSQFPYHLTPSVPGFYPLPKVAFEDLDAYDEAPIGDGPFQMDGTWEHDVEFSVTRYDDYKGRQPKADGIVFKIYSDSGTAYTDAIGGSVDIVTVPQEKYTQVKDDFPDSYIAFDAVSVDWLGLPLWDPRFADIRVREAISLAIDRETINDKIFGGLYAPAKSLTPPTAIGGGTTSCGDKCDFDPERAKELLAEAGGWTGPMEIWFPGGVGYEQTFEAIANQIRQNLGIEEVTTKAQPGFVEFIQALTDKTVAGPFRGHWGSLYPSMQNALTSLFTPTGEANNGSGFYSNPAVSGLIAQGDAAPTPEEAVDFYKQAEQRIMDDFPVVPLFYAKYVYAHSANVSGVVIGHDQINLVDITVNA